MSVIINPQNQLAEITNFIVGSATTSTMSMSWTTVQNATITKSQGSTWENGAFIV